MTMVIHVKERRSQLRNLYGFDFPEDLFRFWEFLNRLAPLEPLSALAETTGLYLVGPFEVLAGRFDGRVSPYHQHLHWRYADDPPEFFTVLAGGADAQHFGYFLDDPLERGGCVASYYAEDVFELEADCETLFEAVRLELEQRDADADSDNERAGIADVRAKLLRYATADRPETGDAYVEKYLWVRPARFARVVAATREGMGIVVPPERYRPMALPDKRLRRYFRRTKEPTALIDEARAALKKGYAGTALKLGKELWATRRKRHRALAYDLLDAAYDALGRDVLRQVLAHHREHPRLPYVDVLHINEG
jgi:hypothetical protein